MTKQYVHKTKDGILIPLVNLKYDHLENIIAYIKRKAKIGITFQMGGGDTDETMWYEEVKVYGEKVKKHMHYKAYKEELKRRNT